MSKKRPGFEAGANLVTLEDVRTWEKVEEHCKVVIDGIPNLRKHERTLEDLLPTMNERFTKTELDKVVLWKHCVGKNRVYNLKHLNANSDASVQKHSKAAISIAIAMNLDKCREVDGTLNQTGRKEVQDAINELGKLRGVGPATASAVLTIVRPDIFCYMYDEVLDCFESKRDYKIANYMRVNNRCLQIGCTLGPGWTPHRVAKTIWTATKFLANYGEDLTQNSSYTSNDKKRPAPKKPDNGNDNDGDEDDAEEADEEGDIDVEDRKPSAASKRQRK